MSIETENEDLKDVLPKTYNTLEKGLLVSLLKNFSAIPITEGDAFGKIYEYFLGKFAMKLNKTEEIEVKKVAKELLETLKREKLVLDWKKRQATRASVRYTVETVLDHLPRVYTPQIYEQKCEQVYQHVFDSYTGLSGGVYAS